MLAVECIAQSPLAVSLTGGLHRHRCTVGLTGQRAGQVRTRETSQNTGNMQHGSNVKVAVAVYSKLIKLCTQRARNPASPSCHPSIVVVAPPLHRVRHDLLFLQKKPLNSEAHEHEGGQGQGAPRRPCEKKHLNPLISPPPEYTCSKTNKRRKGTGTWSPKMPPKTL
jgi:hypothetical protein